MLIQFLAITVLTLPFLASALQVQTSLLLRRLNRRKQIETIGEAG